MRFLLDWWRQRRALPLPDLHLVLYTRKGCHLCAEAAERLAHARRQYAFRLETVDIDSDPALVEKYGLDVPVVAVNGKLRFRGEVNRILLRRLLVAAARARK
jgi:hypothetical protein